MPGRHGCIRGPMTQIAYLVLAHRNPAGLAEMVTMLAGHGDGVALHYDRRGAGFAGLRARLAAQPRVVLVRRRRCGWGEWSLVAATLDLLRAALAAFPEATHLCLISGDCTPIKPRAHIARFLAEADRDFIEHHDFFESDWIKTGLKEERLIYRHFVNERRRKWLFYALLDLQRRLGLSRSLPEGLTIRIGSQWWALRRATAQRLLAHVDANPHLVRFFRTTWIPDETFFQTLVPHVTPRAEIENRTLTFLAFSDYGMPLVLHDDHEALLMAEEHLFARKVSPGARRLRARLAAHYAAPAEAAGRGGDARALYRYYTWRGRHGQRHGIRIWAAGRDIGEGRNIHLVLCKAWHVGRRLAHAQRPLMPSFGYIFDEEEAGLPPLGGLSRPLAKRKHHRRAFLNVLCRTLGTDRLMFCLDPGDLDIIADLARDPCRLRLLDVAIPIDDAFLAGHGARLGLIAPGTPETHRREVIATLHRQLAEERRALERMKLDHVHRIAPGMPHGRMAEEIAAFLDATPEQVRDAVDLETLFD
ncbi:MAG: glycosyl transferase [Paracoccaceae bacterium]|nr:MAG: glycosyl transferase [Paracoccaceae bacterium]